MSAHAEDGSSRCPRCHVTFDVHAQLGCAEENGTMTPREKLLALAERLDQMARDKRVGRLFPVPEADDWEAAAKAIRVFVDAAEKNDRWPDDLLREAAGGDDAEA